MEQCPNHSGTATEIANIKDWQKNHTDVDHEYIWQVIEKIRDRPPVWCTALIALLTGAVGWLAKGLL